MYVVWCDESEVEDPTLQEPLHDPLDDRPQRAVGLLEALLVDVLELRVVLLEEAPERRVLRTTGAIDALCRLTSRPRRLGGLLRRIRRACAFHEKHPPQDMNALRRGQPSARRPSRLRFAASAAASGRYA